MNLEVKFKEETGFDAYADNDLRPKVPSDYYVEWLEEQLTLGGVGKSETKLICECEDGAYVWDNKKEDWTNCISCGLPDE